MVGLIHQCVQQLSSLLYNLLHDTGDCTDLHLFKEIGRGSFGVVHMGIWRGTVVAVKVIHIHAGQSSKVLKEAAVMR